MNTFCGSTKHGLHGQSKIRLGPSGIHIFNRLSGINFLIEELIPPETDWTVAPRQISIALRRTFDVDIDPSFPAPKPDYKLVSPDLLGHSDLSLEEWIKDGPMPNLVRYFHQAKILDAPGPWVMLDGFVSQQDESRGRRVFAFVRSFLIAERESKAFEQCLKKQALHGRWLPEKPRVIYTFAGEMPWYATFPNTDAVAMRFEIAERKIKVRRKRTFFVIDDKEISLSPIDLMRCKLFGDLGIDIGGIKLSAEDLSRIVRNERIAEVEEIQKDIKSFQAFIPVIDMSWEGDKVENAPSHGTALAKQLALSAGLVNVPQTYDLQTKAGIRATCGIGFRLRDYHNSQQFFFIKKDILESLLRKRGYALIWAVWGERELSLKHLELRDPATPAYADFQAVYRL